MGAEALQAYASIAGLVLALIGLPILFLEIRGVQRSVRSAAHAAIYAQAADFRGHLVEYPHLRTYFFDDREADPADGEYDRIVTIAELYLNYLEHVAVTIDSFGRANRASLERFVRNAFAGSPILRRRLAANRAAYSHALGAYHDAALAARRDAGRAAEHGRVPASTGPGAPEGTSS